MHFLDSELPSVQLVTRLDKFSCNEDLLSDQVVMLYVCLLPSAYCSVTLYIDRPRICLRLVFVCLSVCTSV